jgi:hypothetical protein
MTNINDLDPLEAVPSPERVLDLDAAATAFSRDAALTVRQERDLLWLVTAVWMAGQEDAQQKLTFHDALRIACGCTDYGGGHRDPASQEIYQHGISTVVAALTAAENNGLTDMQTRVLHAIGAQEPRDV